MGSGRTDSREVDDARESDRLGDVPMDVQELALDDLVLDPNLNLRDRLDPEAVERYAEAWGRTPPVTVVEVQGRYLLADGFHRHAAAVTLKRRTIAAEVRSGTFADALDVASGANLAHGLPLTRPERRRAVEVQVRLHHERSDRRLAEEIGVGRDLVAKVRRQLVDAGQVPAGEGRVGADGKVYPAALPRDPNEHLPRNRDGSGQDDPRDRGKRESDSVPWDDTTDPLPPIEDPSTNVSPPWETGGTKAIAQADPVAVATPTIDEMLAMMTRQLTELVTWTEAEEFADAYRTAGARARAHFQDAVRRLVDRAGELRGSS